MKNRIEYIASTVKDPKDFDIVDQNILILGMMYSQAINIFLLLVIFILTSYNIYIGLYTIIYSITVMRYYQLMMRI